ncbi:IS110 family transposase [Lacticaseibacillus kribbianus]|uniref:IS110 family transposase n=1 Tax=Lacticaseibacillus kribbianus TaxID=2926292 RepID=UPI001CD4E9D5|nr:IS110 family transposase [Lacticaseibacillus kribbianus]
MLYVGIDVAKNKHDVAVIDSEGTIFVRHLEITNNSEGFQCLKQTLHNLMRATGDTV